MELRESEGLQRRWDVARATRMHMPSALLRYKQIEVKGTMKKDVDEYRRKKDIHCQDPLGHQSLQSKPFAFGHSTPELLFKLLLALVAPKH